MAATNSTVTKAQQIIKDGIYEQLKSYNSSKGAILRSTLKTMKSITEKIIIVDTARRKRIGYWQQQLFGQGVNAKIVANNHTEAQMKTYFNSLETLIEIFGAYVTQRPITSMSIYYSSAKGVTKNIQVPADRFFQARQASDHANRVSLQGLRALMQQARTEEEELSQIEENMIKDFENYKDRVKDAVGNELYTKGAGKTWYNMGHVVESYERYKMTKKRLTKDQFTKSLGRVSWNKSGDVRDVQVKYLGNENTDLTAPWAKYANSIKTATKASIVNLSAYLTNVLEPQLKEYGTASPAQVEAIYTSFVDSDLRAFYGKGGFDEEVAKKLLKQIFEAIGEVEF